MVFSSTLSILIRPTGGTSQRHFLHREVNLTIFLDGVTAIFSGASKLSIATLQFHA